VVLFLLQCFPLAFSPCSNGWNVHVIKLILNLAMVGMFMGCQWRHSRDIQWRHTFVSFKPFMFDLCSNFLV